MAEDTSLPGYSLRNGSLLYKGRWALPATASVIPLLFHEFHNNPIDGHHGVLKTYQHMGHEFYWPGMKSRIRAYIAECEVLQALPILDRVWVDVSMDFIEGLPKSNGYDTILVVVDRLTKYSHFILLRHPFTAARVATVFVHEVIRLHGCPRSIISNRDKIFTNLFWKSLFEAMGTQLKLNTTYHPQTDGQTEVVNRGIETYLRCFAMTTPTRWAQWLDWAEFSYNTSFHVSANMTPFEAIYGRPPPTVLPYSPNSVGSMRSIVNYATGMSCWPNSKLTCSKHSNG